MGHTRFSFLFRLTAVLVAAAAWFLIIAPGAESQPAATEIYLVSGYPSSDPEERAPTHLYRLAQESKTLTDVLELLPGSERTDFIRAYHDLRLLLVATPHFKPERLILLSMDQPCRPRSVDLGSTRFLPVYKYLLDIPNKGLYLALVGFSQELGHQLLTVNLATGQEETLDVSALRFARLPGVSAIGHEDSYQMDLLIDPSGSVGLAWMEKDDKRLIDLGWPVLPDADRALKKKQARWQVAGVDQAMGDATWWVGTKSFDLILARDENDVGKNVVFRLLESSQGTWREAAFPGEPPTGLTELKPFGRWLAAVPVGKRIEGFSKELAERVRSEKRENDHRYSKLLLANPKGEIFLYDTSTGKNYTIRTGDIESEVLLIENDRVYYRIKDRLYRSDIGQGRVEEPVLLAQDPALTSVYWAFSGPACRADTEANKK